MPWSVSPQTYFSDDPRMTGNLYRGDYIRVLIAKPNEYDGLIRVQVYPHDHRQLKNALGIDLEGVWIDWETIEENDTIDYEFECVGR